MKEYEVITYLDFGGNCEEAINAYIKAFGGRIIGMSRFDERNCEDKSRFGQVMHVEFMLGETHMAAGDGYDMQASRGMKLMIHMDAKDEAQHAIGILRDGGEILSELSPHPVPDDAGMGCMLRDKFGVLWIITCPNPDKQKVE